MDIATRSEAGVANGQGATSDSQAAGKCCLRHEMDVSIELIVCRCCRRLGGRSHSQVVQIRLLHVHVSTYAATLLLYVTSPEPHVKISSLLTLHPCVLSAPSIRPFPKAYCCVASYQAIVTCGSNCNSLRQVIIPHVISLDTASLPAER